MSTPVPGAIVVPDAASDAGRRCTATARSLRWIAAILMFAILPLARVMVDMPRTAPSRDRAYTLHKSLGLTVLSLAGEPSGAGCRPATRAQPWTERRLGLASSTRPATAQAPRTLRIDFPIWPPA